jgi:hypothetical protein
MTTCNLCSITCATDRELYRIIYSGKYTNHYRELARDEWWKRQQGAKNNA